jgi:isopentenyl diphosphate isomerase/L-lactate dehydrogenase-like FMN-dependent dehydrogenase
MMAGAMNSHNASRAINIEDLRRMAHRRLPKVVFDYVDGGAEDEITLRENEKAFDELTFRPRHAVSFPKYSLNAKVLGLDLALPFLLAPVGYSRLMHPLGEVGAARAAGAAGTAYILSTISGHALEKVKTGTSGPAWYQLYLVGGREAAEPALQRARAAGYSALVVTIDTAVAGMREKDFRNGMKEILGGNVFAKLPYLRQFLSHPRWLAGFLADGGMPRLPNVVAPGKGPVPLTDVGGALSRSVVTWQDFRWIREVWGSPIVVKGVLTAEDARCAIDHGASAIVVSNHGGRQLDGVSATLKALPEIVRAVNGNAEVLLDGGVRRGSDIVKALCLGARAVLIGRAYAYGLGAAGEAGVARAIEILKADLERTLRLLGCASVAELDLSFVEYRKASNWLE